MTTPSGIVCGTPLRIEFRQDDNPFEETKRVKPPRVKPAQRQLQKRNARTENTGRNKERRADRSTGVSSGRGSKPRGGRG